MRLSDKRDLFVITEQRCLEDPSRERSIESVYSSLFVKLLSVHDFVKYFDVV